MYSVPAERKDYIYEHFANAFYNLELKTSLEGVNAKHILKDIRIVKEKSEYIFSQYRDVILVDSHISAARPLYKAYT